MHLAQASAPCQRDGLAELRVAPLLRAGLEDPLVLEGGVADGDALGDGPPQRLLAVQVLAGREGPRGDDPVPVVGRADHQRVDVVAVDQLEEVVVGLAARVRAAVRLVGVELVDPPLPCLEAGLTAVAHGHDLAEWRLHHAVHVVRAAVPLADHAHGDPLAGRRPTGPSQGRGGHDVRHAQGDRRSRQEAAPRQAIHRRLDAGGCVSRCRHDRSSSQLAPVIPTPEPGLLFIKASRDDRGRETEPGRALIVSPERSLCQGLAGEAGDVA